MLLGLATTALQSQKNSATTNAVKNVLREAVLTLQQAHIDTASMDARILLQHVLGVTREALLGNDALVLTPLQTQAYQTLIEKRKARQPVAQLTGSREFWGITYRVTPHTLDPRPDSETLIEAVLARLPARDAALSVLDLGTGTGCLLLTVLSEYPAASGVGVDICEHALAVAEGNAAQLGMKQRARFVRSRWAENVSGQFDLILSNPPYIPTNTIPTLAPEVAQWEPRAALDGGTDGLDCYRAIMAQLPALLAPGGLALFEIGIGQAASLKAIAECHGLSVVGTKDDLSLITRCVMVAKQTNE
jgi:release factor glutamine methyltransferase